MDTCFTATFGAVMRPEAREGVTGVAKTTTTQDARRAVASVAQRHFFDGTCSQDTSSRYTCRSTRSDSRRAGELLSENATNPADRVEEMDADASENTADSREPANPGELETEVSWNGITRGVNFKDDTVEETDEDFERYKNEIALALSEARENNFTEFEKLALRHIIRQRVQQNLLSDEGAGSLQVSAVIGKVLQDGNEARRLYSRLQWRYIEPPQIAGDDSSDNYR